MAGLKGANAEISDDGKTIIVKAESEATARELAADLEAGVRKREGGPGAKFNSWLAKSLDRFDETLGIYGDRVLPMLRDVLLICAMAMAVFAWHRLLPGYELLMMVIGAAIVFAMKSCAGRLDAAELAGDDALKGFYTLIIVCGLVLEVLASSSLQAVTAVDQETGRNDISAQIKVLEDEQQRLNVAQMRLPAGTAAQQQALVDAYRATPMVNGEGRQLTKTVGVMVDETQCVGRSYYVGIYCPTYLELVAKVDEAKAYEERQTRLDAIPAELAALQARRPASSSTFALAAKGGDAAWWLSLVIPVGLTLVLNLAMLLLSYLTGRSKRTPPVTLTQPVPAAAPGGGN